LRKEKLEKKNGGMKRNNFSKKELKSKIKYGGLKDSGGKRSTVNT
jgi:hypothetical protein